MYRAARVVGDAMREARRIDGAALETSKLGFNSHFIFGGQIKGERPRLFQIYPEAISSKPQTIPRSFRSVGTNMASPFSIASRAPA